MQPEFSPNSLIQFNQLANILTWALNEINTHSNTLSSLSSLHGESENFLSEQNKKLSDMQQTINQFQHGIVSIRKLEDRLASWSERFRVIEENYYSINSKFQILDATTRNKLNKLEEEVSNIEKKILNNLDKSIDSNIEKKMESFEKKLKDETTNFKIDSGNELKNQESSRLELLIEPFPVYKGVKSNSASRQGSMREGVESSQNSGVSNEKVISFPINPRNKTPGLNLTDLNSRLSNLEHQFINLINDLNEEEESKMQKIIENKNLYEVKTDIDKLISKTIKEMKVYKSHFDKIHLSQTIFPKKEEENTEKNAIFKLNEAEKNALREEIFKEIEKKISELEEKLKNSDKELRNFTCTALEPLEKSITELQDTRNFQGSLQEINSALQSQHQSLVKLEDNFERSQKASTLYLNRSEVSDILLQFSKKIKATQKENPELEDHFSKLLEHDSRISKIWKSHNNSLEILQTLENRLAAIEKALIQIQESSKSINLEFKISSTVSDLSDQIKEVKENFKFFDTVPELVSLENEKYFRSMLLQLKTDLLAVKEDIEKLKSSQSLDSGISISGPSIEEIEEPIQKSVIQSILKQHETAIRLLANRIVPNQANESGFPKETESVELSHLEDLKKEMKEMILKREVNQRLSKQDMEVLQQISDAVEGKIGKEELDQKAEKEELKRIYRLLKKRIDVLAEAVKKPQVLTKEEPFFTRGTFNLECASCGRGFGQHNEKKNSESCRIFSKSPVTGVAFSKLLGSLIPNSRGGHRLPAKNDRLLEPLSSPKSQKKNSRK